MPNALRRIDRLPVRYWSDAMKIAINSVRASPSHQIAVVLTGRWYLFHSPYVAALVCTIELKMRQA